MTCPLCVVVVAVAVSVSIVIACGQPLAVVRQKLGHSDLYF